MLTSEHAIIEYKSGRAFPDCLTQNRHAHYADYAQRMLDIYRKGIGSTRRQLHNKIDALFRDEPDCPIQRIHAFCKLLDEKSVFHSDQKNESSRLRLNVFADAASFHPLVERQDRLFEHEENQVKERIASQLSLSWEQIQQHLYADVFALHILEQFEGYSEPQALLSRYNVAQLQTCLYRAERLTVRAHQDFKTILRYAKLAHLLHRITQNHPSDYTIELTGPASVSHQTRRYGVNFAKFIPALLACRGWSMKATLRTPWDQQVQLSVSDRDRYQSHLPPPGEFDSTIEEKFADQFGPSQQDWQLIREGTICNAGQQTFVPDFVFRHKDGTEILMEIVGFWTPEYLEYKRQLIRKFKTRYLLIALPEKHLRPDATGDLSVVTYKTTLKVKNVLELLDKIRTQK